MIPLSECKERGIYRLRARNLTVAVWAGDRFVGLREKFGEIRLDMEVHAGSGGTAWPVEFLEMLSDDCISLRKTCPSIDRATEREVAFDDTVVEGGFGHGWHGGKYRGWYFVDTGEVSEAIDPISVENKALLDYLTVLEHRLQEGE